MAKTTASPSLSQELGRAAKFIRLLEQAGMTADDFQLVIDSSATRQRVVSALRREETNVEIPRLDRFALSRLVNGYANQYHRFGKVPEAFREIVADRVYQRGGLRWLAEGSATRPNSKGLHFQLRAALWLRFSSDSPPTLRQIGDMLGTSADVVSRALEQISHRAGQVFDEVRLGILEAAGLTPLESIIKSSYDAGFLNEAGLASIEQLLELSEAELAQIYDFPHWGASAVPSILSSLRFAGLTLKRR